MGPRAPPHLGVNTTDTHLPTLETQKNTHTAKGSSPLGWLADQVKAA